MARGKGNRTYFIENQITLFDFNPNKDHYIAQASTLIRSKQKLKSRSKKLINAAIMQIRPSDKTLNTYVISIQDFANMIGVSSNNLYRDIESITDDIIKNPVYIRTVYDGGKEGFVKIPWVEYCQYIPDIGIVIQLSNRLKPYLIGLKERYEEYQQTYAQFQGCIGVFDFDSFYTNRLFELLADRGVPAVPVKNKPTYVEMPVEYIKECLGCENNFERFSNFREKVLDKSVDEINSKTIWRVSYSCVKKGRSIDKIKFCVS